MLLYVTALVTAAATSTQLNLAAGDVDRVGMLLR